MIHAVMGANRMTNVSANWAHPSSLTRESELRQKRFKESSRRPRSGWTIKAVSLRGSFHVGLFTQISCFRLPHL